jgi:hypothetical protein
MVNINVDSFLAFCKGLEGQSFSTVGGRATFTIRSVDANDGITYYVESTDKERPVAKHDLPPVLQRFAMSNSLRPVDYLDLTVNASYTLALVKLYIDNQSHHSTKP